MFNEPAVGALVLIMQTCLIAVLLAERARLRRTRMETQHQRAELAHAARLTAVGQLTASIAHEINQPLGAILSNAEAAELLLARDPSRVEDVRAMLAAIRRDDLRASSVVGRMRKLLRKGAVELEPVDLNSIAEEVAQMAAGHAARAGVAMRLDLAADLPLVRGDRVHLEQVLLNLVLNGIQAMSGESVRERELVLRTAGVADELVEVAVRDTGRGIAPDDAKHLFEPFFTTRSQGLGLGLSIARSIVEAHGGRIWAECNRFAGATMRLRIPVQQQRHLPRGLAA